MCQQYLTSWKISKMEKKSLYLADCTTEQLKRGDKLFLFVSRAQLSDYGKYKLVKVKKVVDWSVSVASIP